MQSAVVKDTFENISSYLRGAAPHLRAPSIFVLPGWLEAWWRVFGSGTGAELYLHTVRLDGKIIGIAPLLRKEKTVSFIGSPDLCDYLDFIVAPGAEREFGTILLDFLAREGVARLELHSLRPDSAVIKSLAGEGGSGGPALCTGREDVSLELDLPAGWDEYLALLSKKQRHEVRRKLRRLEEAGRFRYFSVDKKEAFAAYWPLFFKMFVESRPDKADFLSPSRKQFITAAVEAAAGWGLAKLGVLELEGLPAAMVLYFDYRGVYYLYNSAYDPGSAHLSAGLMAKVCCIREAVERGRRRFDFLKGGEPYKYRLGGREIPIFSCRANTAGPVSCARPPRAFDGGR